MAIISGLTEVCAGLAHPKQPYQIQKYCRCTPSHYCGVQLVSRRGKNLSGNAFPHQICCTCTEKSSWALKSLFIFLLEQPSQLKYIEWPSFQSTLKTASLTLILMALLIVALASVDSALCYLLALFLRKSP
ncbi:hypothetical protein RHGRI_008490 [Rhododendron griersonianum]|uniref:Uncharacterized protein n=1 Tax=Rhododendron griersonianum TaxID=479676 RepID=A0AAV6L0R0_9ERIC|nr:hypothetical protein RHGRI_008490 [Rhododendron griersonianum]